MDDHVDRYDLALLGPDPEQASALAELTRQRHWLEVEGTIRKLYAPNCNDAEWTLFTTEARDLGLDPVRGEYIAMAVGNEKMLDANGRPVIGANGKEVWRKAYQGYITIAGVRALAARSGILNGQDPPQWAGRDGVWREFWAEDDAPFACKVTVYVKGMERGFTGICTMKRARTYVDRNDGNRVKLTKPWLETPEKMLEIRAEYDAYKRAGLLSHIPAAVRLDALEQENARRELAAGRKVHAIAAGRGVDHDGVRAAARSLEPLLPSLAEADEYTLSATADVIDVLDPDGIETVAGVPAEEVKGEPHTAAPAPDEPDDASPLSVTNDQFTWVQEYVTDAVKKKLPPKLRKVVDSLDPFDSLYADVDAVIIAATKVIEDEAAAQKAKQEERAASSVAEDNGRHVVAAAPVQAPMTSDVGDWTTFWKEAKAEGVKGMTDLLAGSGEKHPPTSVEKARALLDRWLANKRIG